MKQFFKYTPDSVITKNDGKVYMVNTLSGEYVKLSEECFGIIDKWINSDNSKDEFLSRLYDDEDRDYISGIIDLLTEKYIIADREESISRKMAAVNINLTHRCNLKCIHCQASAEFAGNSCEALSTEEWKKIIDKVVKLDTETICISGGEPMIRPDFFELSEYIREHYSGKMTLMTNGMLITEANADRLISLYEEFNISLDGADEKSCSMIRGKGVFDRVMKSVDILKSRGIRKISLSMVDTSLTHDYVDAFYELNKKLETLPMVRGFSAIGRGAENSYLEVDKKPFCYEESLEKAKRIGCEKRTNPMCLACNAAKGKILINHKGDIYPCAAMEIDEFNMGNLLNGIDDIEKFWNEREIEQTQGFKNLEELSLKNDKCKNCSVNIFCSTCLLDKYIRKQEPEFEQKCALTKIALQCYWK